MLLKLKDLNGYNVAASDAPAGEVKDTYFDDLLWVVRYLVVDTRAWIRGREVLISPLAVTHFDLEKQRIVSECKRAFALNTAVFLALGEEFPLSA